MPAAFSLWSASCADQIEAVSRKPLSIDQFAILCNLGEPTAVLSVLDAPEVTSPIGSLLANAGRRRAPVALIIVGGARPASQSFLGAVSAANQVQRAIHAKICLVRRLLRCEEMAMPVARKAP